MPRIKFSSNEKNNNSLIRCYNCSSLIKDKSAKYCKNCNAILNPNDLKWRNSFLICICLLCLIPLCIAFISLVLYNLKV
jgi:hypothetical protein